MSEWFSSLASQALEYVDSVTDSLVTQANDAQNKLIEEQTKLQEEQAVKNRQLNSMTVLPWETEEESLAILSQDLMEHVLALPSNDLNFTSEPPNVSDVPFQLSEFIPVAMNLLRLDTNLARVHSRISPKMDEEVFWRNYYCRIAYLRASSGIEGVDAQTDSKKWEGVEIVYSADTQVSAPNTTGTALSGSGSPAVGKKSNTSMKKRSGSNDSSGGCENGSNSGYEDAAEGADDEAGAAGNSDADGTDSVGPLDDLDDDLELLGELEALDDEDFEEIGKSEYTGGTSTAGSGGVGVDALSNDELEAQIARELAEDND